MTDQKPSRSLLRFWPFAVIAAGFATAYAFGLFDYLTLDTLRERQSELRAFVSEHYWLTAAAFIGVYFIATVFVFPGALWITIAGGFLFGLGMGTLATEIGATLGASALFFAVKTSLGDGLRARAGGYVEKAQAAFAKNPLSYMFALRFFPVMPFFAANVIPAILGAKYRDYLISTAIGILPGVIAYTWIGAGLSATFARGEDPDIVSLSRDLLPPMLALFAVSLVPVMWKKINGKKRGAAA